MSFRKRRKMKGRVDAKKCLARWRKSGLSMSDWATENRVDCRSLNGWRLAMERHAEVEEAKRASLVELVLPEAVVSSPEQRTCFVVRAGCFEIEVLTDFDSDGLGRLLSAVRSAC